jgi:hypothetical protein
MQPVIRMIWVFMGRTLTGHGIEIKRKRKEGDPKAALIALEANIIPGG